VLAKAASTTRTTAIVSLGARIAVLIKKPRICGLLQMGLEGYRKF
jgi:hypothetical protein